MTDRNRLVADWYEDRRLRLIARSVHGSRIADLGYAHLPNPYLVSEGRTIVGVDLVDPTGRSGYDEEIQGDVMSMAPPNIPFDTVVAGELLEHLESPYDFLRRIRGLLSDTGTLVLSTPNPLGVPMVFYELFNSRRRFYARDHTFSFPPRWVARLLDDTGYSLERLVPVGLWNPLVPIPWAPPTISYQVIYLAKATARCSG